MELKIEKLAHIDSATLKDDSDLTIIVGDNGTGKTLLLETYALLQEEINDIRNEITNKIINTFNESFKILFDQETKETLTNLISLHKNTLEELYEEDETSNYIRNALLYKFKNIYPEITKGLILNAEIIIDDTSSLNASLQSYAEQVKLKFINQVESKILFNSSEIKSIDFIKTIPTLKNNYSFSFNFRMSPAFFRINRLPFNRLIYPYDGLSDLSFENLERRLQVAILHSFIDSIFDLEFIDTSKSDVLLIPTERNSIIANSNLRTRKELENSKVFSRYSEFSFTLEFLKFKEELEQLDYDFFEDPIPESETITTLSSIEESNNITTITRKYSKEFSEMLGGNLIHDKQGKINSLINFEGKEISSRLFSTKQNHVSSFAILDENIRQYDLVIIEEPEANLSLIAIKQLVDYLFYLMKNYKTKFILTTHNELFFQRMNLLLLKNQDISSRVYEFKKFNDRNTLVELSMNNYGYTVDLFNSELEQIFKESNEIQSSFQKENLNDSSY